MAGIQRCNSRAAAPAGVALVDITDPRNPTDLAFFDSAGGAPLIGVHELDVAVRKTPSASASRPEAPTPRTAR